MTWAGFQPVTRGTCVEFAEGHAASQGRKAPNWLTSTGPADRRFPARFTDLRLQLVNLPTDMFHRIDRPASELSASFHQRRQVLRVAPPDLTASLRIEPGRGRRCLFYPARVTRPQLSPGICGFNND